MKMKLNQDTLHPIRKRNINLNVQFLTEGVFLIKVTLSHPVEILSGKM